MAKINAIVVGGQLQTNVEASTANDARLALGLGDKYTVVINNNPSDMSTTLSDGDFVTFTENVKGNSPKPKTLVQVGGVIIMLIDGKITANGIKLSNAQMKKIFKECGELLGYDIN